MKPFAFNSLLLKRFPEIKYDFDAYASWQDGLETGSFLIVEDVLTKHIWKSAEKGDFAFIKRVFEFAEDVLNQGDEYACNVIVIGLLETIKSDKRASTITAYLLPRARQEYESIKL